MKQDGNTDFERGAIAMRDAFAECERNRIKLAERHIDHAETAEEERYWEAERDIAEIKLKAVLAMRLPTERNT